MYHALIQAAKPVRRQLTLLAMWWTVLISTQRRSTFFGVSAEIYFRISSDTKWYTHTHISICSMYGIFTNICPNKHPVLQVNIPYMENMGYTNIYKLERSRKCVLVSLMVQQQIDLDWRRGQAQLRNSGGKSQIQKRDGIGWWLTYPSEKYEFVSWDDYSKYMEK